MPPLAWRDVLADEKKSAHFRHALGAANRDRADGKTVYPPAEDVFNAFRHTELHAVKVVILGQDPYHGPGQAHGLCFSVRPGVRVPPSLVNIYKELADDIPGFTIPDHGCLTPWAERGVLLLNNVLTVEAGRPQSHAGRGWERFTDRVVALVNDHREHVVFLLWGSPAQKKGAIVDRARHGVFCAPHPSPLSAHRGFLGCRHFSRANRYLADHGVDPVDWTL